MLTVAFDARDALAADARGWGRYARSLLAALRNEPELGVAALSSSTALPEVVWEQGVLPLRLARLRPDVVHAPSCFLPLLRPCAGVVSVHDLAFEVFPEDFAPRTRAKFVHVTPRAARSAERVLASSTFTKHDLIERYGVDPERIAVVGLAPSLAIGDAPIPGGAPYLLGIGDLRAKKNWVALARAWRALGETDLRLVIAGVDSGVGDELRALGVETPGYVDDRSLDALLRGAVGLVHPSLYEGFGLVVAEALVRGIPVAVADATALPETIGDAGELFDPHDVDAIAASLQRLLANREDLARRGLVRGAELTWERTARATVRVYAEAVAAR